MANNIISQYLGDGAEVEYPAIALAFGWSQLKITFNPYHAGDVYKLVAGGNSVNVTLNSLGIAEVSLLPFIKAEIEAGGAMATPLVTGSASNANKMRCAFNLDIYNPTDTITPDTIKIYAIFGSNSLKEQADKYINYNADNLGSYATIDLAADFNSSNQPTSEYDWLANNKKLNQLITPTPTTDTIVTYNLAQYVGDKVLYNACNLHLLYDCRTTGVRAVRWVDSKGGINVRKLSLGTDSWQGAHSNGYKVPHSTSNVPYNSYYHGRDEWYSVEATRTLTLGDNSIPNVLFDWLKELASSPIVDVYDADPNVSGGLWVRCNVADATIEKSPKKSAFSLTLKLVMPTDEIQRF